MFLSPSSALREPEKPIYPGKSLMTDEIRVLWLQPGKWTDPIVCELNNVCLGTVEYRALSYVWGSRFNMRSIRLNGRNYPVTLNLETALRHLRVKYKDGLVLWVDALCINQADSEERTRQVEIMGRIYELCRECLVYLGQSLDGNPGATTEPAPVLDFGAIDIYAQTCRNMETQRNRTLHDVFEFFHKLSNSKHFHETLPLRIEHQGAEIESGNHNDLKIRSVFFEALRMFMHAPFTPWWSRIWTVQEVALPPHVILSYGTITAPWTMFSKAANEYKIHSNTCCREFIRGLPRDQERVVSNSFETISAIQDLRLRYHANRSQSTHLSLLDLLSQFRDRRASDPRDKVYALLSMARLLPGLDLLAPDYSLSEAEVFRIATLVSIYSTKSLSVFSTELGRKFRSDLASWVPDWGAPGGHLYRSRANMIKHYKASMEEATPASIVPIEGAKLRLRATRITTVERVGEIMWGEDPSYSRKTLNQWFYLWLEQLCVPEDERPSKTGENRKPSQRIYMYEFWKAMCADVIQEHITTGSTRKVQPDDMSAFETWAKYSSLSPFSTRENRELASNWSSKAELWSLFLSTWPTEINDEEPNAPNEYIPSHLEDLDAAYNAIHDLMQFPEPDILEFRSGDRKSSFDWRTLYLTVYQALRDHYGADTCLYSDREKSQIPSIERSISIATLSRRLIYGSLAIGLGPADMAVGDEICLLPGGKTPFILRPRGFTTRLQKGEEGMYETVDRYRYEIIGDCYVDGWMDGMTHGPRPVFDIELV
ncbi:hypothetical protein yc1106_04632 [Curvularia clavata]|uniref:Heterokaryon incompatibility domain-containing protein n=1 Tax=Curvularia clavata TaxID=95742 RepID=A0A9Q8ZBP3_CURCL|nr:hypothetical protein yc1106_04632 [Curvularia clavata]